MINRRHVLREIIDAAKHRIRPSRLNSSRSRPRIVERISAVQMSAMVSHIINFNDRIARQLLLYAEIPMLIGTAAQMRVSGIHRGIHTRAPQRLAEKEVPERTIRNGVGCVEYSFAQ